MLPNDPEFPLLEDAELAALPSDDLRAYLEALQEWQRRLERRKLWRYYPETGPLRRELYAKHMEFFRAGARHRERLFIAANRVGKTEGGGGIETTYHLTGHYPDWWEGKRFFHPIDAWAGGKTNEMTRDILQACLFGGVDYNGGVRRLKGTGLVPGDDIGETRFRRGGDLADTIKIRHHTGGVFDGWSTLGFKSYEQGRGAFEGTAKHLIWLDEEPELAVYTECLIRTMTTEGHMILTFTPLEGLSDVVLSFLPGGEIPEQEAA